jgi:hypothetical protein
MCDNPGKHGVSPQWGFRYQHCSRNPVLVQIMLTLAKVQILIQNKNAKCEQKLAPGVDWLFIVTED